MISKYKEVPKVRFFGSCGLKLNDYNLNSSDEGLCKSAVISVELYCKIKPACFT